MRAEHTDEQIAGKKKAEQPRGTEQPGRVGEVFLYSFFKGIRQSLIFNNNAPEKLQKFVQIVSEPT
jgi:hypothetical protein